jgi:hypothetical protein
MKKNAKKSLTYWLIIEIEFEEDRRMGAGRTAVHVQHLSHPEYNCELQMFCTASQEPFLYRKRPPQQNGDMRKRDIVQD